MPKECVDKVKIFVSYHKNSEILKSEILTPIHVGAACSSLKLDMQRDDDGDNISAKNDRYCELTAQYWAWKNVNADYYGFMHYRRHFAFRELPNPAEFGCMTILPRMDADYRSNLGLNDSDIYACVKDYDVILPMPVDIAARGMLTNEIQFSSLENLHAVDFELMCQTILELYPEYQEVVAEFRKGKNAYWYNMFIMRKAIFFDYCEWMFHILENTESKIDFTYYSEQETRTLAFMAERLLSIYILKLLKDKQDLRVKNLNVVFLENTAELPILYPAFRENNIAIAVSCNEGYMPILGVMLSSLLENGIEKNNYDILILWDKMGCKSERFVQNSRMFEKLAHQYTNTSIRFVDISRLIQGKEFYVCSNFTPETYFRLFLPQVLGNYEKVLYLDADMVICHDVAELYKTDLAGNLLGAVRDPIICGANKSPEYNRHDAIAKLGIKNIYNYFQTGVLLIDLKKIAENSLCEEMIEYAATHNCDFADQDVLNLFCQGKVKFIDNKWNVNVNNIAMNVVSYAPTDMCKEYKVNRKEGYIYHFAGVGKPWNNPKSDLADVFWDVARRSIWYEMILEKMFFSVAYSQGNMTIKSNSLLDSLSLCLSDMMKTTAPIKKAYLELSSIGLSDEFSDTIRRENDDYELQVNGKRVIFYGAGYWCKKILLYFDQVGLEYPVEIWDIDAQKGQRLFGIPVQKPNFESLQGCENIFCVITIESKTISDAVKYSFAENGFKNVIDNKEMMRILYRKFWSRLDDERKIIRDNSFGY